MRTAVRLLFLLLLVIGLAACGGITRDHGYGECKEYEPICLDGQLDCTVDSRGCRICTCVGGSTPYRPAGPIPR